MGIFAVMVRGRAVTALTVRESQPRGQDLLRSDALAAELVAQAGVGADEFVMEIGARTGRITEALARSAQHVVAIELDPGFADGLRRRFRARPEVDIVEADVLQLPLQSVPSDRSAVMPSSPP